MSTGSLVLCCYVCYKSFIMKTQKTNSEKTEVKVGAKKTKMYLGLLAVGLVLVVGGLMKDRLAGGSGEEMKDVEAKDVAANISDDKENYLEGLLQSSDDQDRGNLKLLSGDKMIYLRTGRDFGALIGSEVLVFIDGTLESFKLLDIQGKIEKDGFIRSN